VSIEASDALRPAREKAKEWNCPWSEDSVTVKRWRLWPFAGVWKIVSKGLQGKTIATVTLIVNARTGKVTPHRNYAVYRKQ